MLVSDEVSYRYTTSSKIKISVRFTWLFNFTRIILESQSR